MENHHFYWDNSLYLWPFSIAMQCYATNYQRLDMFIPFYGFRASKASHGTSLVCWFACFFPNKLQVAKAEFKKYDLVLPRGVWWNLLPDLPGEL
jgi:hypothetical protein